MKSIKTQHCAFPFCTYRGTSRLFKFPSDFRRSKWLEVTQLSERDITGNTTICHRHFVPEAIQKNDKVIRLKSWAIPRPYSVRIYSHLVTEFL